jgi:hypothetical protein
MKLLRKHGDEGIGKAKALKSLRSHSVEGTDVLVYLQWRQYVAKEILKSLFQSIEIGGDGSKAVGQGRPESVTEASPGITRITPVAT